MQKTRLGPFVGLIIAATFATGCPTNNQVLLPGPGGVAAPQVLVAADSGSNEIAFFNPTDNGNIAPQKTIVGPATQIANPTPVTRDSAGNVYVGQNNEDAGCTSPSGAILVFGPSASGNAAPARTISGSNTTLDDSINGIAVDNAGNIYVSQDDSLTDNCGPAPLMHARITIFGPSANGNAAPVATIIGGSTALSEPQGLFFDHAGHIWVADTDTGNVLEFPTIGSSTGNLNVTPIRTLNVATGVGTDSEGPVSVALDEASRIYVLGDDQTFHTYMKVYAAGSSGAATPSATITCSCNVDVSGGIIVGGGFIYVATEHATLGGGILVFKTTDNGAVTPTRDISGGVTTLGRPEAVSF